MGSRLATRAQSPVLMFALVAVAATLVLGVLLTPEPGKEPLNYPNANAALAVQILAMGGLSLVNRRIPKPLMAWLVIALALTAMVLNRSAGALAVGLPLLGVVAVTGALHPRHPRWKLGALPVAIGVVVAGGHTVLQLTDAPAFPSRVEQALDSVRVQLWHDALHLWRASPATGSGPGSFAQASALAQDPDTSTAHSSVLQIGAETGWVGVTLFGLVVLTGLLWAARGPGAQALIGMTAWTALAVHSLADHLLEFGPVVLAAGIVLGWAGASQDVRKAPRPPG